LNASVFLWIWLLLRARIANPRYWDEKEKVALLEKLLNEK
jgi:hypothetical protein